MCRSSQNPSSKRGERPFSLLESCPCPNSIPLVVIATPLVSTTSADSDIRVVGSRAVKLDERPHPHSPSRCRCVASSAFAKPSAFHLLLLLLLLPLLLLRLRCRLLFLQQRQAAAVPCLLLLLWFDLSLVWLGLNEA